MPRERKVVVKAWARVCRCHGRAFSFHKTKREAAEQSPRGRAKTLRGSVRVALVRLTGTLPARKDGKR